LWVECELLGNYANEFRDADSSQSSEGDSLLYATLMSIGCNIPLAVLARSWDLDYQALWWVANNHFSDESVKIQQYCCEFSA
jgi:Tn3 transposase DDE domain